MPYWVIFITGAAIAASLTPVSIWLSFKLGAVALPGGRRKHGKPMPRLGGVAIGIAFFVAAGVAYLFLPPEGRDALLIRGVLIGAAVTLVGGVLDDIYDLPWWAQFLLQFLVTLIAFSQEVFLERFTNPVNGLEIVIRPYLLVAVITIIWVSGIMNTVNWIDGLDGLATGVGAIAALLFAFHSFDLMQFSVAAFPIALAGALLGFLPFNFSPARVYLGSAGAYLLGFTLATFAIIAPAKIATALLVLVIPLLDAAWLIIYRIRQGNSPLRGDRNHLHFRLSDSGISTPLIVLGYYAVSAASGAIALFAPGIYKLYALIGLGIVLIIFIFRWSKANQ